MKQSKLSLLTFLLAVALAASLIYILVKSKEDKEVIVTPPPATVETPPKVVDSSLAEEKTYKKSTDYASFDVKYPSFKNAPAEFNKKIADFMMKSIEDHEKTSQENWQARFDTDLEGIQTPTEDEKFQLYSSWAPVQLNNDFISFTIHYGGYTGGAHGYENIVSFNYDLKNKKEISLADLFPNNPNYLKTISDFSRKDLEAQFRKRLEVKTEEDEKSFAFTKSMLMDGTAPTADNFSVFTFTTDKITFYFTQYQVAPYAMGESTVSMSRK